MYYLFQSKAIRVVAMITFLAFGLCGAIIQWVLPPPRAILPLPAPTADGGYGWIVSLPKLDLSFWQREIYMVRPVDNTKNNVTLLEDGQPLPNPNCGHQDIRDCGEGRYSYWGNSLFFSTSKNDDPSTNGRKYEVEIRTQPKKRVLAAIILSTMASLAMAMMILFPQVSHYFLSVVGQLQAFFRLRPEAEREPGLGFPTGNIFGPGFWVKHAFCLVVCVCLALMCSYFRASVNMHEGYDAAAYQAHGRSLMERGTVMLKPLPYNRFIEKVMDRHDEYFADQKYHVYPSLGFQLLIGALGKWRGDYSYVNGLIVATFFNAMLSIVLYLFSFSVTRSRFLSVGLVGAGLANPIVMGVAGRPLTDIILLFFLFVALWPMSIEKSLLSGFIFGLGYLFREPGITLLPVLALASPKSVTWRGYVRSSLTAGCGYGFWLVVNTGLLMIFQPGSGLTSSSRFYVDWQKEWWGRLDLLPWLENLANHLLFFARFANPIESPFGSGFTSLAFFVLIIGLTFIFTTIFGRRLIIIGLWSILISSLAFMMLPRNEARYGVCAIFLFWTAIVIAINRFRFRNLCFTVLLVIAVGNLPHYTKPWREDNTGGRLWADITAQARTRLSSLLKPGSVILTSRHYEDEMIFSIPNTVYKPDYKTWRTSPGNELIDAITFYRRYRDWQDYSWPLETDVFEDAYGVRFVRFKGFGDELDEMKPDYVIYLREQIAVHSPQNPSEISGDN